MQSLGFIKLTDKFTMKDFVVALDPITYIIECVHSTEDKSCKVYYDLPNSEIDYVTDSVEHIAKSLEDMDEIALWAQDLSGRLILINPAHLLRLEDRGDPDQDITLVTLSDGTQLTVQESITEILYGMNPSITVTEE